MVAQSKWAGPIEIQGRRTLISGGNAIRIWDWDDLVRNEVLEQQSNQNALPIVHGEAINVIAANPKLGPFIAGSTGGRVRVWQSSNGSLLWSSEVQPYSIKGLAIEEINGEFVLVTGREDGLLQAYDLSSGKPVFNPLQIGNRIQTFTICVVDGEPLCFVVVEMKTSDIRRSNVVRVWNLLNHIEYDTREPVLSKFAFRLPGWEDKTLNCVCCEILDGEPILLAAGAAPDVSMWNIRTRKKIADLQFDCWVGGTYVNSLICGNFADQRVAVTGCDNGAISMWNLRSKTLIKEITHAHGGIAAVAITKLKSSDILISGGMDGFIKVWSTSFTQLLQIDIDTPVTGIAPLSGHEVAVSSGKGLLVLKLNEILINSNKQNH